MFNPPSKVCLYNRATREIWLIIPRPSPCNVSLQSTTLLYYSIHRCCKYYVAVNTYTCTDEFYSSYNTGGQDL